MTAIDARGLVTASLSDVGRVRAANEDYCSEFAGEGGVHLLVVADGMGGHRGGATASRLAVETIGEVFGSHPDKNEAMLHAAFAAANDRVYQSAQSNAELHGMGTTAVLLLMNESGQGWIGHIGDSRAYRFRNGKLEPLTHDHSVVGAMIRQGLISEEEASSHPRRNEILRSVGVEPEVDADLRPIDIEPGDRYLLCSDGLTGLVSDEELAAVLQREPPSIAARTLVDIANSRGGNDNITVQIAAVPGGTTTEVALGERVREGAWAHKDEIERDRQRDLQIAAIIVALLAGIIAVGMLYFVISGSASAQAETTSARPEAESPG